MELTKKGKEVKINFTGTMDLMNYIDSKFIANRHSQGEMRHGFCPYDWEATRDGFLKGWAESESIKINADRITMEGRSTGYTTEFNVTGDFIDVGDFLSGVPECWGSVIEEPKAMKQATVLIDCMAHCGINAGDIENRGSAIISMIDQLRESGHYLSITIASYFKDVHNGISIAPSITFETDNGYSRDVLAFCIAHPGMLRRMFFGVLETYFKKNSLGSYGSCGKQTQKGYDIFLEDITAGYWGTIEAAKGNIDKVIENYERKA